MGGVLAYAFYHISAEQGGDFYLDYRDDRYRGSYVPPYPLMDIWIKYDSEHNRFGYRIYLFKLVAGGKISWSKGLLLK